MQSAISTHSDRCATRAGIATSIGDIGAGAWNKLVAPDTPFLAHAYLATLEASGCASPETGWEPQHVYVRSADDTLIGTMPLYLKQHSNGEFVFDWTWADGYATTGRTYYPKLVAAIPFTPVTGQRLLTGPGDDGHAAAALLDKARALTVERECSSLHVLFPTRAELRRCRDAGFLHRYDCRFIWQDDNYQDFAGFLAALRSTARKKIRRERRRVADAAIRIDTTEGDALTRLDWQAIHRLYTNTFLRRGMPPYFSGELLAMLADVMRRHMVVFTAHRHDELIAAAILFRDATTLYGRHWGCSMFIPALHFELCYYHGIEYCLANGLTRFDPGTHGEHKLRRGFAPELTGSAHWFPNAAFAHAVDTWLKRERPMVIGYRDEARRQLPFRRAPHATDGVT